MFLLPTWTLFKIRAIFPWALRANFFDVFRRGQHAKWNLPYLNATLGLSCAACQCIGAGQDVCVWLRARVIGREPGIQGGLLEGGRRVSARLRVCDSFEDSQRV